MRIFSAALIVVVLAVLATTSSAATNCSALPSLSDDFYHPPGSCVKSAPALQGCFAAYEVCLAAADKDDCAALAACTSTKLRCIGGTTVLSANCTNWAAAVSNEKMYLTAGGLYLNSNAYRSCEISLCEATLAKGDSICMQPNFTAVCGVEPNFEEPTRAPTQVQYSLTFGGNWDTVFAGVEKGSEKYVALEFAVTKGLSELLGVPPYMITILRMVPGSLIVDFIISSEAENIDPAFVKEKLQTIVDDPSQAATAFTALADASGKEIVVTGFGLDDPTAPTPAPPRKIEEEASCNSGCVAGVVVGIIIFLILLAIGTVMLLHPPRDVGTGTQKNEPASNHEV